MGDDLKKYRDSLKAEESSVPTARSLLRLIRKPRIAIPAVACLLALCAAGAWFFHRQSKIRWAREQAIPEVQRLRLTPELGFTNHPKAYKLAVEAERYIPGDAVLSRELSLCSAKINIKTEPPGAAVYMKEAYPPDAEWQYLGVSPIENIRLPVGYFWWRMEKQGYETALAVAPTSQVNLKSERGFVPYDVRRVLDPAGKLPPGMVRVLGAGTPAGQLDDFFIDKYEVTNKQYKAFVDGGGYRDRKYWKHKFIKDGRELRWEEATAEFRDQTGRPGPSTWQAGDHAKGQEDYPVSGISWYEAAAYAEYAGKSLPSMYHWARARGQLTPVWGGSGDGWLGAVSNFKGEGPAPVGSYRGMNAFGTYDMAGNVREWCWNETKDGRVIRGGAWDDAIYMMSYVSQAPAFDRSPKNGFRCTVYPDRSKIPDKAFEPFTVATAEFHKQKRVPVPDSVFQVYKQQFAYDKTSLEAKVESRKESSGDWIQERVTIDAAYGGERLPLHLFLPKRGAPPYQTVIYFPGSGSAYELSSKDLERYREFEVLLSFIVKSGRAVVYPIYKGTFERRVYDIDAMYREQVSRRFMEYNIQLVKDFRRGVDYLETRPDVDSKKLAYLGYSWGGTLAPLIIANEERVRASVLVVGGYGQRVRSEVDLMDCIARVRIPTLMLNGKYDMTMPFDTAVKPMFDTLGTPKEHKRLVVYDMDHFVPHNELVKETLAWLDRYLGPVK